MATRPNRRVAADRLAQARQQLRSVNIMIGRHGLGCSRCARAGSDPQRFCDDGWQLAKAQARAQSAVRQLSEPSPAAPVQGTLW